MSVSVVRASPEGRQAARQLNAQLRRVVDPAQWGPLVQEYCVRDGLGPEAGHRLLGLLEEVLLADRRDGWLAFATALCADAIDYDLVRELYAAAAAADLDLVKRLLLAGDAAHRSAEPYDFPPDDVLGSMTLGERKALARRPDPQMIDRLVLDADVDVVRILFANPRVTEKLVLRLAARRPNRAHILAELARSPRWICRTDIQRALVLNPYTPTRLAVTLAPLLSPPALRQVAADGNLHPLLRQVATELVALRDEAGPYAGEEPGDPVVLGPEDLDALRDLEATWDEGDAEAVLALLGVAEEREAGDDGDDPGAA